ncbi:major facilitator superfamily domain-containing protein [Xylariaceae sp. FL0804]|nr:major facilitator superfamily domain-containing protein [Xylariaceae sp. FL0804]
MPGPPPQGLGLQLGSESDSDGSLEKQEEENEIEPPPNGGLIAWLQVAACAALYLNTLGILNTYGVYQTYYETTLLKGTSPSVLAWVGSVQSFLYYAVGVFIGPLWDKGYFRSLMITGTVLVTLGFMTTSVAKEFWQVLLAQGFAIGLGASFLSIPSIALVPQYFAPPRRAWAMSTCTMGSGVGATVYPIFFQNLVPRIGFGWTTRILGFISFALCLFALAVARPRYRPSDLKAKSPQSQLSFGQLVRNAKLTDTNYLIYVTAIFFNNLGFFEPLVYLESYAMSHGLGNMPVTKYLLPILNASSLFGRLVPALVAGKLGITSTFIISATLSSASVFYWISATTAGGNIAFAVIYGFAAGGVVAFAPVVLTSITEDLSYLGTRLGALNVLKGIGSLAGTPIAGAIVTGGGGYLGLQLFTGFILALTTVFSVILRIRTGGRTKV